MIWCLDELKSNIQWLTSVGIVYKLPAMLEPVVWPWLAYHVWYFDPKVKDVENWTNPETYLNMELLTMNTIDTEIDKFKKQYMNFRSYRVVSGKDQKN